MDTQNAQTIIGASAMQLERFVRYYLLDRGISIQLVEVVAKELGGVTNTAKELVSEAITNLVDTVVLLSGPTYNLQTLLDGAVSLEFLVRYARKLDPSVMPPEFIPTDEVVDAALAIFHQKRSTVSVE